MLNQKSIVCVLQVSPRDVEQEQSPAHSSHCPLPEPLQQRREVATMGMDYLSVPPALGWGRTRASAHSPMFRLHTMFIQYPSTLC